MMVTVRAPNPGRPRRALERRRYRRWPISLPVRETAPEVHVICATSVSAGGVFCPNVAFHPVGTKVLVEIDTLSGKAPVTAAARVVHSGTGEAGLGMGLEFFKPQWDLERAVSRWQCREIS